MARRSIQDFAVQVAADPELQEKLRADPVAAIAAEAAPAGALPDNWIYRVVVTALGLVAVGGLGLVYALVYDGKTAPDIFTAAISAAIGALAGLLAPSPGNGQ